MFFYPPPQKTMGVSPWSFIKFMEFFEVVQKRHCCRNFNPERSVSRGDLEKILKAGRMAPSAGNVQDWRFKILQTEEDRRRCAQICADQLFMASAPVIVIISSDLREIQKKGKRGVELYAIQDTAAAAENMFLAATALGLGACWVGAFDGDELKKAFKIPDHDQPMVVMPIGSCRE